MRAVLASLPRAIAGLAIGGLVLAGLVVAGPQRTASADSAPADPTTPTTVAADGLPTTQIDGVAWAQAIVGGTVYVAGQFTTARPAGAAAGTQTVPRSDLLAYDLATGVLVDSWAPTLNGAAYSIAGSADGTQIYVGGDFTRVNGVAQNRFVVLDAITGERISRFNPNPDSTVRAITSTSSTIYFGGRFNSVAGISRPRLAALNATTGGLLSWRASAQSAQVDSILMSPDHSRVIVGGRFDRIGTVPALGSAALAASNAAVLQWDANKIVTDYGYDSGIESLTTDGNLIYGSGFAFLGHNGGYGNLEGIFAANPNTGAIVWIEDCHGDTYSIYADAAQGVIYGVGHPHFCSNIGSFPLTSWKFALAFSTKDVSTITPNTVPNYFDWQGFRAPANLNFFPDMTGGTFTGTGQAAWSITGSGDYVTFGGEFLTVEGVSQQGLVRMARAPTSTNQQGLRLTGSALQPAGSSQAAGTAQVSWPTNWDRDNETLTYAVLRDGSSTPLYTTTANSTWWERPRVSFTDTGLVNGRSYSYRIRESDPFGNTTTSPSVSVVAGSSSSLGAYALGVMNDNPAAYWRLGDTSGSTQDWTGYGDSSVGSGVVRGVPGALFGDTNKAAQFTGASTSRIYGTRSTGAMNHFSLEAWIKTTSTTGGRIVGFGDSSTGTSTNDDRHLYLGTDGRLNFGVYPAITRVITTPDPVNDGQWHHVVATLGATGMRLFVDGDLLAERADVVSAGVYSGYWRIGGDAMSTWPGAGADDFVGDIDDVAIYGRALTPAEVAAHHTTGTGGVPANLAPTARFTATGGDLTASVDGSTSTDLDGTIASYAWNFGDGATGTGVTANHAYLTGGTKTITLTVTDNAGASGWTSHQVEVTDPNAPNQPPVASFTAAVTGLSVLVDGTATTDADGTVTSYAWDFGDGAAATTATASHVYSSDGPYTITLTAIDNDGAQGTATRTVTVAAAAPVLASDAFARTVASGWGSADVGGAWSATGTTSVTGATGQYTLSGASSVAETRLPGATGTSVRIQVTESWNKRPSGSGGWFLLRGRITSGGSYRLKVGHKATGSVTARVVRTDAAGAETAITSEITVPGVTYSAGTPLVVLFDVSGASPTVLRGKVWAAAQAEPAAWLIQTTDATAGMQGPGYTGLAALTSSTTTNGPLLVAVDNLTVTGP